MLKGIRLNPKDNVGVVAQDVKAGDVVVFDDGTEVKVLEDIGLPHKVALTDIQVGEYVYKYGHFIGYATKFIPKGAHVHVHNVDSEKNMK